MEESEMFRGVGNQSVISVLTPFYSLNSIIVFN